MRRCCSCFARRNGVRSGVGAAAVFLASECSAYVNGELFMVDGGFTIGAVQSSNIPASNKK